VIALKLAVASIFTALGDVEKAKVIGELREMAEANVRLAAAFAL
jgi:hypothetical protein